MKKRGKRLLFILVFIVAASYTLTSVNSWTFQNRMQQFTRYAYFVNSGMMLLGKGIAPFQYRILQPLLVYSVFSRIALPWRDDMGEIVFNGIKSDETVKFFLDANEKNPSGVIPANPKEFDSMAVRYIKDTLIKLKIDPVYRLIAMVIAPTIDWHRLAETGGSTLFRIFDTVLPGFENIDRPGTFEYSMVNGSITSEFFYLLVTMFFLFLLLERFVDFRHAFLGLVLFSATLPLTFNVTAPETALSMMFVTIGIYLVAAKKHPAWLFALIAVGSFARADQMMFLAVLYLTNELFREKARRKVSKIVSGLAMSAIPAAVMLFMMYILFPKVPNPYPASNLVYNLTNPWTYVYVPLLFNVELLFLGNLLKKPFYRRTLPALVFLIAMDLVGGMVEEVRILMPAYVYMLPAAVTGIKKLFSEEITNG